MTKGKLRYLLVAAAILAYQLQGQSFPPPKPLTDEEEIGIILQRIEQGIKDQDILAITDGFARVYNIGDTTSSRFLLWERLGSVFDRAEARRSDSLFQGLTPANAGLGSTWDFEMEIDTVRILGGGNALAETWIYFGASPPDTTSDWQFGKKHRENIMFKKIGGEWRVKRVEKLLKVLRKYGKSS